MDILLNNEINTRTKGESNSIGEFINELRNALDNPKNEMTINKDFYNEIYNELELATKYKDKLEDLEKTDKRGKNEK